MIGYVVIRGLTTADLILEPSTHCGVMENGVYRLESSCNFIINSIYAIYLEMSSISCCYFLQISI